MSRELIKRVLNSPYKPIVDLALEMVNLKDKELLAVQLVDLKGITIERASEKMNCSVNSVKNYRNRAFDKMSKAWEQRDIINKILEG